MSRCGCSSSCTCAIVAGTGTTVTGNGSQVTPYRIHASGGPPVAGSRGAATGSSAIHNNYVTYDIHSVGEALLVGASRPFYTVSSLTALAGTVLEMLLFGNASFTAGYSFVQMSVEKIADASGAPLPVWAIGSDGIRPWIAAIEVNGVAGSVSTPNLATVYSDAGSYSRPGPNKIGITDSGVYLVTTAHQWSS